MNQIVRYAAALSPERPENPTSAAEDPATGRSSATNFQRWELWLKPLKGLTTPVFSEKEGLRPGII
jgi:hypothetical protein